jgi:hypothetical protein
MRLLTDLDRVDHGIDHRDGSAVLVGDEKSFAAGVEDKCMRRDPVAGSCSI